MNHHDEADYAEYAEAAWRTLVRSAVFLGCSLPDAEDLAQTTLVRCYTAWPKVAGADKSRLSRALAQLSESRHLTGIPAHLTNAKDPR